MWASLTYEASFCLRRRAGLCVPSLTGRQRRRRGADEGVAVLYSGRHEEIRSAQDSGACRRRDRRRGQTGPPQAGDRASPGQVRARFRRARPRRRADEAHQRGTRRAARPFLDARVRPAARPAPVREPLCPSLRLAVSRGSVRRRRGRRREGRRARPRARARRHRRSLRGLAVRRAAGRCTDHLGVDVVGRRPHVRRWLPGRAGRAFRPVRPLCAVPPRRARAHARRGIGRGGARPAARGRSSLRAKRRFWR